MNSVTRLLTTLLWGGTKPLVKLHLAGIAYARDKGLTYLGRFLESRLQRKHGVFVSHKAIFPKCLELKHPVGIVIGEGVRIGQRVRIYQHVTLGGARSGDAEANQYPHIDDDTTIFAGAVVIGRVRVGKNCVIGANAVVTKDVPDNSTAVGVPARILPRALPKDRTQSE